MKFPLWWGYGYFLELKTITGCLLKHDKQCKIKFQEETVCVTSSMNVKLEF